MEDKTEKKKKVSETDKYLSKRLSTEDFMKKIKHLLHDKKSVNLLIWPMITVPSVFTPLVCFQRWGLKSTSSEGGFLTMTMNDFFQSAVDKGKENMLPTLLFAYIGNDSVVCDIPALLRKLKAELPGVEIFIFCSKIYSQEKANAIYNLIEDTIVKKYTVSDSIFHDHERMKNCISGIQSFLEE